MGYDIPSKTTAAYPILATVYNSDIAIVEAGFEGFCVQTGCQLVAGTNAGTVKVNAGTAQNVAVLLQNNVACCANADATNPRWALYELDALGVLQTNLGTPNVSPEPPTPTSLRVVIAAVYIPANASVVDTLVNTNNGAAKILDKRIVRSGVDIQRFAPIVTGATDITTQTFSTTTNAGAINLNTLTGTQTFTLTSTAGAPTAGVITVTHAGTIVELTYNGISGNNLQNVTNVAATSLVIANGDVATNNTIITSASTAAFASGHVGSYILPSAPGVGDIPNGTTIANTGTVPGGTATYARLSAACTGAHSSGVYVFRQVAFGWTKPQGARYCRIYSIGGGGGGASGAKATNTTTDSAGGGGGGGGGFSVIDIAAADIPATQGINVGIGGPGGWPQTVTGSAVNVGFPGVESNVLIGFTAWFGRATGGSPGAAVSSGFSAGGASGVGLTSTAGPTGGRGAGAAAAASSGFNVNTNGGLFAGTGGGGGGLTGSGSVYLSAASGGTSPYWGFLWSGSQGGGGGGQGANGGNGSGLITQLPSVVYPGSGGGGGGGRNTTNAAGGNGGNGGLYGGGAGGGGNGVGTGSGGAGGTGGDGLVLIITYL